MEKDGRCRDEPRNDGRAAVNDGRAEVVNENDGRDRWWKLMDLRGGGGSGGFCFSAQLLLKLPSERSRLESLSRLPKREEGSISIAIAIAIEEVTWEGDQEVDEEEKN